MQDYDNGSNLKMILIMFHQFDIKMNVRPEMNHPIVACLNIVPLIGISWPTVLNCRVVE